MNDRYRTEDHAVVIGGSIAGLLAARVLADRFDRVTVIDRDEQPTEAVHRRGVPQSRHTHGLLARGYEIMEDLLPGFGSDLIARGAIPIDLQNDILWYSEGHLLRPARSPLTGLLASRPLLESYLRTRVAALPQVRIHARTEAVRLRERNGRITGVDTTGPAGPRTLETHIVVDASGRSNRGPVWLTELGYPQVPEETVRADLVYATREYRRVPGAQDFAGVISGHYPGNPVGTGATATDGDRWLVTLLGMQDDPPPAVPGAFEEFAARLDGPELHRLISTAEPLSDPTPFRIGPNVRRRYERCSRLPEGFLAVGDALCCVNPAYGQGMTTAAMAANQLRTCLRPGTERLTKRYFSAMTRIVDVPWDITVGADLRFPDVSGPRTVRTRLLNAYLSRLHRAASADPEVGAAFLNVANFMVPPQRLVAPRILWRVWRGRKAERPAGTPAEMASGIPA
jgi:2-polyprenyl-6-methoxyphenol hydroxylase-like FAD-dependent oxidoreductase